MCRFLLVFGCFGLCYSATWTLNLGLLEKSLSDGIKVDEFVGVLEREGVEVCFQKGGDLTLFKGERTTISLAEAPFSPYHLWIEVQGRKTLDECTVDELAELYESVWKGKRALAEVAGADSFMIFMTEQMRNGKGSSSVGIEIIPCGSSDGVMDAVEKIGLNGYVFYNQMLVNNQLRSPEIVGAIRERLQALIPSVEEEAPQGPWTQKLLRHQEAIHHHLHSVHDFLVQNGALIKGEMVPMPLGEEKLLEIQINLDRCAFCNPKVIEKQLVLDWGSVQILMNHKPISPYGHFLIIPKRHQCAWNLSAEEAVSSFRAVIALKKFFAESVGSNDWICYIQDGPGAGQTVPHAHLHFYLIPSPLKTAISTLQHIRNQRPILSPEEMRLYCEKIKLLIH